MYTNNLKYVFNIKKNTSSSDIWIKIVELNWLILFVADLRLTNLNYHKY